MMIALEAILVSFKRMSEVKGTNPQAIEFVDQSNRKDDVRDR
jgi:hypothetical protein